MTVGVAHVGMIALAGAVAFWAAAAAPQGTAPPPVSPLAAAPEQIPADPFPTFGQAGNGVDWGDLPDRPEGGDFSQSRALCRGVRTSEPPIADRPDPNALASLAGCDSEALYYGIGVPRDPARARLCAFTQTGRDDRLDPFSGRPMLMVIYANGEGASRNLDVAMRLACGLDAAPYESDIRVRHLAELRSRQAQARDFHYCDDITSGLAGGQCAGHRARIAQARRAAGLGALMRGWSEAERRALAPLIAAHTAYREAHASGEIDARGTLRGAFWVQAEEALERQFLEMLQHLSAGRNVPAPRDFATADRALNAAYRARMRGAFDEEPGAVRRDGVRDAQRAWLRYRDAFLAFAAIKYPHVPRSAIAAWLTRQRTVLVQDGPAY